MQCGLLEPLSVSQARLMYEFVALGRSMFPVFLIRTG